MNQRDAAAVLGLTTRQIRNLDESGIPSRPAENGRGRVYDLTAVVPWYIREVRNQARTDETDLDRAKLEKEQLEVRRRQLELAQVEGGLIRIDDHLTILGKFVSRVRSKLLGFPGPWGPRIVGIASPAQGTEAMRTLVEEAIIDLRGVAAEIEELEIDEPIPDDFPGFKHLAAAHVTSLGQLSALKDPTTIRGIGAATAKRIRAQLPIARGREVAA